MEIILKNSPIASSSSKPTNLNRSKLETINSSIKFNAKFDEQYEPNLPENKKSLSNKPFKIITPDKPAVLIKEENKNVSYDIEQGPQIDQSNEEICHNKKVLELIIMESPSVKPEEIFTINENGLVGSKRNVKDGHTYFGTYSGQDPKFINDYVFPIQEKGFGKRHFSVFYDSKKDNYYLNDLGAGTGTFIKIIEKYRLTVNLIISFNNLHLAILLPTTASKVNSESDIRDKS